MKIKNKGFSLVELLVAMAAFSIVMIGIISLMRSASISFRNESMEVDLERDAQVVMAQIEELVVDCKAISATSDPGTTVSYSVTEPNGTSHSLSQIGTNILLDGEILADNIDQFHITGLKAADGLDDNICYLDVRLLSKAGGSDGKEFAYDGYKQIYFRNDIDGVIASNMPDLDSAAPGPGPANTLKLDLGRYEVVNLYSRFGMAEDGITWTPSGNDGISFADPAELDAHGGLSTVTHLASGVTSLYITTNATCNKTTNDSYTGTLTGYKADADGNPTATLLTVLVTVPQVKLQLGSGIIEVPCVEVNDSTSSGGGGFYSYIQFDGFCCRDYEKYTGNTISANVNVKLNGTSKGTAGGQVISAMNTGFADGFNGVQVQMGGGGWNRCEQFGVFYDYTNPQYLVVKFHNGDKPSADYLKNNKVTMSITVTYPHDTSTATQTVEYRLYTGGSSLSGFGS